MKFLKTSKSKKILKASREKEYVSPAEEQRQGWQQTFCWKCCEAEDSGATPLKH